MTKQELKLELDELMNDGSADSESAGVRESSFSPNTFLTGVLASFGDVADGTDVELNEVQQDSGPMTDSSTTHSLPWSSQDDAATSAMFRAGSEEYGNVKQEQDSGSKSSTTVIENNRSKFHLGDDHISNNEDARAPTCQTSPGSAFNTASPSLAPFNTAQNNDADMIMIDDDSSDHGLAEHQTGDFATAAMTTAELEAEAANLHRQELVLQIRQLRVCRLVALHLLFSELMLILILCTPQSCADSVKLMLSVDKNCRDVSLI